MNSGREASNTDIMIYSSPSLCRSQVIRRLELEPGNPPADSMTCCTSRVFCGRTVALPPTVCPMSTAPRIYNLSTHYNIILENVLNCAVCEATSMAVKKVLENDKVDRNIVHIVEKACAMLTAKYHDRVCHVYYHLLCLVQAIIFHLNWVILKPFIQINTVQFVDLHIEIF